ncbi:mtDNA inheritance, partitioning of the mitochondrial organelle [Savitreella phatthalungensis]
MHEIITLQLGTSANYLATHFWNIQEHAVRSPTPTSHHLPLEDIVDHDVLFRQGLAPDRSTVTFTPRALIYDRGRSFGALKRVNELYQEPELKQDPSGAESLEKIEQDQFPLHPFQTSLDETEDGAGDSSLLSDNNVNAWSDYATQFFHPRSYLQVNPTASSQLNFDDFDHGVDLFRQRDAQVEIFDNDLRSFLEDSDGLQGFQIIASLSDGWSGFTSSMVTLLADELPKQTRWLFATGSPASRLHHHNIARTLADTEENLTAFVPFLTRASYSASADAAAWLDDLTLPARRLNDKLAYSDITSFLYTDRILRSAKHGSQSLTPSLDVTAPSERRFLVTRTPPNDSTGTPARDGLESALGQDSALTTTYSWPRARLLPKCFPHTQAWSSGTDDRSVSIEDSATGARTFLKDLRDMVQGIRGAHGYTERKELVSELLEYEDRYRGEMDEELGSSAGDEDEDFV